MGCCELTINCYVTVTHESEFNGGRALGDVTYSGEQVFKIKHSFSTTLIVSEICWVVVVCVVKTSILALYWRLFSARNRSLRVIIWALAAFVVCWGIAVVSPRSSNFKLNNWHKPDSDLGPAQSTQYLPSTPFVYPLALCGVLDTTYHHRCSADKPAGACHMEITYAQDTQIVSDGTFRSKQLVCRPFPSYLLDVDLRAEAEP